jgi:hypothetical protein
MIGGSQAQRRTRGQGHPDFHEHRNHSRGDGDPNRTRPVDPSRHGVCRYPYGQNPQLLVTDGIGGSPCGPGTLAGADGSRQPVEAELTTARNLGTRLARVAAPLRDLRASPASAA